MNENLPNASSVFSCMKVLYLRLRNLFPGAHWQHRNYKDTLAQQASTQNISPPGLLQRGSP